MAESTAADARARLLVVDDEEAILETMSFTFEDEYDVLTAPSAKEGLALLEREGPVAVVISDQRMPETTGVEFLAQVFERYPTTVRIILTGFADMDATIGAINDGHVYAYVTKPWEPDELKRVVKRGVDHYFLAEENERLLSDLRDANVFLEAVLDEFGTGAVAVDAGDVVRAMNRPARRYLGVKGDPRGQLLDNVLSESVCEAIGSAANRVQGDDDVDYEELELHMDGVVNLRVSARPLEGPDSRPLGRVILIKEISHEPLRRRFDEIIDGLLAESDSLRTAFADAQSRLQAIAQEIQSGDSPGMVELAEGISRTRTAMDYWIAVDDALSQEDYPDAQSLRDRMRLATSRWPRPKERPARVAQLAERVESYYETGENPKQPIL
ncbi:MAG: response regulator [Myxococcota bacterium]|nr:response regulator [Myxococcota bacterium]